MHLGSISVESDQSRWRLATASQYLHHGIMTQIVIEALHPETSPSLINQTLLGRCGKYIVHKCLLAKQTLLCDAGVRQNLSRPHRRVRLEKCINPSRHVFPSQHTVPSTAPSSFPYQEESGRKTIRHKNSPINAAQNAHSAKESSPSGTRTEIPAYNAIMSTVFRFAPPHLIQHRVLRPSRPCSQWYRRKRVLGRRSLPKESCVKSTFLPAMKQQQDIVRVCSL